MLEKSKLNEDKEGKAVDPSPYRGMIGTLFYLTASRPDLQFAICMCTRNSKAYKEYYACAMGEAAPKPKVSARKKKGESASSTTPPTPTPTTTVEFAPRLSATAKATVHHHAIRFKMDNKKRIINLESLRDMLHICLRVPGQSFVEPPFEEEILAFILFLGHNAAIRKLTDVNINKLYQPWRSFAAIINKCLIENSSGYDNLRLSQAQILCGLYHKRNIDYAYLMWEDFVYQDPSIPRRNKFGAILPIELTNEAIRNSNAYKEYYAVATGAAAPKPKASVQKTRSSFDTTITPPTAAAGQRLTTSQKGKQTAKASKAKSLSTLSEVAMAEAQQLKLVTKRSLQQTHISQASGSGADEGTGSIPGVLDVPTDKSEEELSWNSTEDEGDDEGKDGDGDKEDYGDDGEEGDGDDDDEDNDGEEGDDDDDYQEVERDDEKDDEEEGGMMNKNIMKKNMMKKQGMRRVLILSQKHLKIVMKKAMVKEQVKVQVFKILPTIEKTVNEQLEAEVLTRSSNSSKTSYAVAAYLSEMELKKILIEKMEGNKSIHRSNEQRNLYKAFVEAYESDKIILDTYGDTITLKRCHDDDADKDEEPFARPDMSPRDAEKERSLIEEPMQTTFKMEEPAHLGFETGADDQPTVESIQPWISDLVKQSNSHSSFNELMDTPVDFFTFLINRLNMDTLTPELLAGPTYKLLKESCKRLVELEYHLKEVYKATTDQLDWVNPEGQQYPHNLLKPLPLIPNNQGRRVIPFGHFINNDLEYLHGGASSRKYTTSVTKTKAAYYGHIKWIEDFVPRTMWIEEPIGYDKHALWGVSHWGRKRQQFYGFAINWESARDVYSKDVNINQGRGIQTTQEFEDSHVTPTPVNPDGMESIFETTLEMDVQTPTSVAPLPMTAPTMTPSIIATITTTSQEPIPPITASGIIIQHLPNFGSLFGFDNRMRTLEANLSEFIQTN
nr:hypothetical protein [Tanacetum cinerariifolium]